MFICAIPFVENNIKKMYMSRRIIMEIIYSFTFVGIISLGTEKPMGFTAP